MPLMNNVYFEQPFEVTINTPPTYWYCEPGWEWRARPLDDYLLWYVMDGIGVMRLGQQAWELRAGSCFVFTPGAQPHGTQHPDHRLVVFGMHFTINRADSGSGAPNMLVPPPGHVIRDTAFFALLAQRCQTSWRHGDALGELQSRHYLQTMLLHMWDEVLHGPPSAVDTALHALMHAMQLEPGRRWQIDKLAQQVHLSRAQFERRFRAVAGCAPNQFIIRTRLERARDLINETTMPLSQIAAVLGYDDVSFFSRQYKRVMGHAPSAQRQRNRG